MATDYHNPEGHSRILIVDDTPIVRLGLSQLINRESDMLVCGEAADVYQALQLVTTSHPNIAVVDMSLRGASLLGLLATLQRHAPTLPLLVVSMHDEVLYAQRALRAGARGYIAKQVETAVLLRAIRQVLHGEIALSEGMASRLLQTSTAGRAPVTEMPLARLSDREAEVLHYLGQGYSTRQIAERLYLSVRTIETHRASLLEKLRLENARELMLYAIHWHLRQDDTSPHVS